MQGGREGSRADLSGFDGFICVFLEAGLTASTRAYFLHLGVLRTWYFHYIEQGRFGDLPGTPLMQRRAIPFVTVCISRTPKYRGGGGGDAPGGLTRIRGRCFAGM
jgi:hypothetical protein